MDKPTNHQSQQHGTRLKININQTVLNETQFKKKNKHVSYYITNGTQFCFVFSTSATSTCLNLLLPLNPCTQITWFGYSISSSCFLTFDWRFSVLEKQFSTGDLPKLLVCYEFQMLYPSIPFFKSCPEHFPPICLLFFTFLARFHVLIHHFFVFPLHFTIKLRLSHRVKRFIASNIF